MASRGPEYPATVIKEDTKCPCCGAGIRVSVQLAVATVALTTQTTVTATGRPPARAVTGPTGAFRFEVFNSSAPPQTMYRGRSRTPPPRSDLHNRPHADRHNDCQHM